MISDIGRRKCTLTRTHTILSKNRKECTSRKTCTHRLSLFGEHQLTRKNKARRPRFPFQTILQCQRANIHEGTFQEELRRTRLSFRNEPASHPPCLEVAAPGAQGVTASAVGALYGQPDRVSTRQIRLDEIFLTASMQTPAMMGSATSFS